MAQEGEIIYVRPAVAQGETHSAGPAQPSFHLGTTPSPANERHFTLSEPSLPLNVRHLTLPGAAMPANNSRYAKPPHQTGKTAVALDCRVAFRGNKSIFQACSMAVMGLAGLKSGRQAAGSRLPFKFCKHELSPHHTGRLRLRHFINFAGAAENTPLKKF